VDVAMVQLLPDNNFVVKILQTSWLGMGMAPHDLHTLANAAASFFSGSISNFFTQIPR
jgi:hypothetical protein